jgi:sugar lactone lactonase YvrE
MQMKWTCLKTKYSVLALYAITVCAAICMGVTFMDVSIMYAQEENSSSQQRPQEQSMLVRGNIEGIWETLPNLRTPESVVYYLPENTLFVSNINGEPTEKDQNGFITKVSFDNGNISQLNWIEGLNAPKGMAISDNKLYISDINELVEADIRSGQIINRYNAPDSAFLNDVAVDNQGIVYVSDTGTNSIYRLEHESTSNRNTTDSSLPPSPLELWLKSDELNGPNGLYVDNDKNKLIVASFGNMSNPGGSIKVVDIINQTVNDLGNEEASPYGGLDGIESGSTRSHYYVSDWPAGKVYLVNSNGTGYEDLLDLKTQGTADIEFIADENILVIPLMQDNKLVSYRIQ